MKKQASVWLDEKEMSVFEMVKEKLKRSKSSDAIRYLINQEAEKILKEKVSNEIFQTSALPEGSTAARER